MGENMVELTAADVRQCLFAHRELDKDLVRVRSMLELSRSVCNDHWQNTKTVAKEKEASVLPYRHSSLARGQMVTHISNVAADYMEGWILNADSMLVMARLFGLNACWAARR